MTRILPAAAALTLLLLTPSVASAELRTVRIQAVGMDCPSCVRAVNTALKKLDGVESVELSLEKSTVELRLKADNKVTIERLRYVIRASGYDTKDADITARGRIVDRDGKLVLDLLNGSTLELTERPKDATDATVEVTGVSKPETKTADRLTIKTMK